ncbi:hypothetical protein CSUNSWCD_2369 [Campylobacter showae CSUNSWCD]|uniref:Uncharacterized protein n=1 Tax=Campylobacter showae CSUNSWCD TaxID=1244083 RepID=M5IR02_9BACT|nr:hypothetical protein CSUNSWCD_2369 [Campylobacter showae CSUNSWCD]
MPKFYLTSACSCELAKQTPKIIARYRRLSLFIQILKFRYL